MKKVMVVQSKCGNETEYRQIRENAGKYVASHLGGSFILLEPWVREFVSKEPKEQAEVLFEVMEEAQLVLLAPGWTQDPMCRIVYEMAGIMKKPIVEVK